MSVLYLHTAPAPKIVGTDAIYNEVELLHTHFGGSVVSLFPLTKPNSLIPRSWYGWHIWRTLKHAEKQVDLIHVFSPGLYHYPVLAIFKKPVVFTVAAAISPNRFNVQKISQNIRQILVTNVRDQAILQKESLQDVKVVGPGLDLRGFKAAPDLPSQDTIHLLMASAPWEMSQFETKGVNLLLDTVSKMPNLELTLLWRGRFKAELTAKIKAKKIEHRVKVIDELADVPLILKQAHATILLAKNPELVKAYPHSLVESLAMGRPVIISNTIAMADYVHANGCGLVLSELSPNSLQRSISMLRENYVDFTRRTKLLDVKRDFSQDKMLENMHQIYKKLI